MRHLLNIIFAGIFLIAACSSPRNPAEMVVAIESFPSSLDPRYPTDAYSSKVQRLLFNGLLRYDNQLRIVPDLANGFEYLSDTELKFSLREDVRFHNGKPLTAHDVQYTFESILYPGAKSPLAGTFSKVGKITVLDDHHLVINLKEPFAPFLTALTIGIVPKGTEPSVSRTLEQPPVGTGPFAYDGHRKDQWIRLKTNPGYFAEVPHLKDLEFQTVPDDTTRVLKILRGEVGLVQNAIPLVMAEWLKNKGGLELMSDEGINYTYMAFNLRDDILKKQKVRTALGLALDREALIRYQLKGFARPATGILAPSNWFYEPEVNRVGYDPDHAKNLLDEAGYPDPDGDGPGTRFTLTFKTSNRRDRVAMARAIAREWEKIGVGVEIRSYEWGTFYRDIRTGNFQVYTSTWVGVTDPDIYHYVFHSGMIPPKGANRGYYQNETVDQLLDLARSETNPETRKEYYSKVQKLLSYELPYLSLWYEDNVAFLRKDVAGYELRPDASFIGLVKVVLDGESPETQTSRAEGAALGPGRAGR